ncbi:MAG: hypothetical protein GY832_29040 [Chloroflexi bacterium]|nr:hypothetical protein [Chloroflexota bacterium]
MSKPGSWLKNLFERKPEEGVIVDKLTPRINLVVEGILENESLTSDLDDAAAQVLLDWGTACVKMIAQSTAGLDDVEAEEIMSPRLRATRRLMRQVNRRVSKPFPMNAETATKLLTKVIEQATIIYGKDFVPSAGERREAFLKEGFVSSAEEFIVNLRSLIETSIA